MKKEAYMSCSFIEIKWCLYFESLNEKVSKVLGIFWTFKSFKIKGKYIGKGSPPSGPLFFLKNGQINRVTKVSSTFRPTESDSEKKNGWLPSF